MKRCFLSWLLLYSSSASAVDLHGHGPWGDASVQVNSDLEIRYHHVDDKLAALSRLHRCLNDDGKLMIVEPNYYYPPRWIIETDVFESHKSKPE